MLWWLTAQYIREYKVGIPTVDVDTFHSIVPQQLRNNYECIYNEYLDVYIYSFKSINMVRNVICIYNNGIAIGESLCIIFG